jgi:hypothetical protein
MLLMPEYRQVSVLLQANSVLAADPFGVRPTVARLMMAIAAVVVAIVPAYPRPVPVVN